MQNNLILALTWLICWMAPACLADQTVYSHSDQRKPGSLINLISPSIYKLKLNQLQTLDLIFDTVGVAGNIKISIHTQNELSLSGNQQEFDFIQPIPQQIKLPIEVQPQAPGTYKLNIFVSEKINDHLNLGRAMAVLVNVEVETNSAHTRDSTRLPAKIHHQ